MITYVLKNVKNGRYVCGDGRTTPYADEAKEWPLLEAALKAMAEWDDVGDTLLVVVRETLEYPYFGECCDTRSSAINGELTLSPDLDENGRLKK